MQMRAQGFDSEKDITIDGGREGSDTLTIRFANTLTIRTMQIDKKRRQAGKLKYCHECAIQIIADDRQEVAECCSNMNKNEMRA